MKGFVLTKQTEGKSPRTVEFYGENLKRFLWYANKSEWSDDVRLIDEWHIREFLGYVASETSRWELNGNGSESSKSKASLSTVHHYYVVLVCLFNWIVAEGYSKVNPTERVKVKKPKPAVIVPYSKEEIRNMLAVCDYDYEHNAKLLASRNRAILLVLLDTGVRLSELIGMKAEDVKDGKSDIKVQGKGNKGRVVRI
ncbi:MAG: tyrosine-type recombinase/integrase, partial [Dehalococcoidales bacterium]